ncbi:MAG: YcxB family protein [Acidobacteriota bacterium]
MKVHFDATLDDFVDITLRAFPQPNIFIIVFSALSSGLTVGIVIQFFFGSLVYSGIIGLAGAAYMGIANHNIAERKTRKLFTEKYGIKGPVPIDVRITDSGISFRQQGTTTIHDWETVKSIEETDDAIYFKIQFGGYSAVRKRAFANDNQIKEFLDLVNSYLTSASQT